MAATYRKGDTMTRTFKYHHVAAFINDALDIVEAEPDYEGSMFNEIVNNIEGHEQNREDTVTLNLGKQTFLIIVVEVN
jgi:hypothetical protein